MKYLICCLLLGTTFGAQAETRAAIPFETISFYEVRPVSGGVDGRLEAALWKEIPEAPLPYEYWKTVATPGELESTFQVAYDSQGIYLRVYNHEARMDRILTQVVTRGDPYLWKDDCLQLYFDPTATSIGYVVFTVNALGMRDDRKQLDGAVSLDEWQGENWQVWANREANGWVVEMFFPYSDLERTAQPGDVWRANLVRYGYATGEFKGTSWSLGGNYALPGKFGYFYFGREKPASAEVVAQVLRERAVPPWSLSLGGMVLRYSAEAGQEVLSAARVKAALQEDRDRLADQVRAVPGCSAESAALAKAALEEGADEQALLKLTRLYWRERLRLLLDETTSSH